MMTFPIYGKKNIPNHQPVFYDPCIQQVSSYEDGPQPDRAVAMESRWFSAPQNVAGCGSVAIDLTLYFIP